jgi:hypothetical protein
MATAFDSVAFATTAFEAEAPPPPSGWADLGDISPITDLIDRVCTNQTNPDWAHSLSTLTYFDGRVYLGYGDWYCNYPSVTRLVAWDIASGVTLDLGQMNSNAVLDMRVDGGMLAVPFNDLGLSASDAAAYVHADNTVELISPPGQPIPWHVMGSAVFGGKRYLSGSHQRSSTQDGWAIWREDNGTWTVNGEPNSYYVPSDTHSDHRVYGLFVLGTTLYAGRAGVLMKSTTGALGSWSNVSGVALPPRMKRPLVIGGNAYYGSGEPGLATGALYKFNGTNQTTLVSSGVWDHTVGTDGNLYYLTSTGAIKNEAGTTVATAPANARSIAFINGAFWVGTSEGRLWKQ